MLPGLWGLPRSGIETVSHKLAGRFFFFFLTTEPPGKPWLYFKSMILQTLYSPGIHSQAGFWAIWGTYQPSVRLCLVPAWLTQCRSCYSASPTSSVVSPLGVEYRSSDPIAHKPRRVPRTQVQPLGHHGGLRSSFWPREKQLVFSLRSTF